MTPNKRMQHDRRIGAFLKIRINPGVVLIQGVLLSPAADARALDGTLYFDTASMLYFWLM